MRSLTCSLPAEETLSPPSESPVSASSTKGFSWRWESKTSPMGGQHSDQEGVPLITVVTHLGIEVLQQNNGISSLQKQARTIKWWRIQALSWSWVPEPTADTRQPPARAQAASLQRGDIPGPSRHRFDGLSRPRRPPKPQFLILLNSNPNLPLLVERQH